MRKKLTLSVFAAALVGLVSGCASTCGPGICGVAEATAPPPAKLMAVGYGAMGGHNSQYTLGQQKLMAMRAARIDAYRNLAEQVNGFRISGSTTVSSFVTQSDSIRTYVDAYLSGARVVGMTPVADGNFEATVELDLSSSFLSCVAGRSRGAACGVPARSVDYACGAGWGGGCVQPGGYYYTVP